MLAPAMMCRDGETGSIAIQQQQQKLWKTCRNCSLTIYDGRADKDIWLIVQPVANWQPEKLKTSN